MKEADSPKSTSANALTVFLSISSAAAVVLALLGYGVALSAEERFGIPHAAIFNSTSDLLTLGGWAIVQMLSRLNRLSEWVFYIDVFKKTWPATKLALAGCVVVFAIGSLPSLLRLAAVRWPHLSGHLDWGPRLRRSRRMKFVAYPVVMLCAVLVAAPVISIALVFAIALMGCFLGIAPIVGINAGKLHIDDWVIGPPICAPTLSRDARLKPHDDPPTAPIRVANCVAVKKDGGEEYRGRVVFATFNAIVLYEPATGSVRRVSTDGARVEVIDKL
ncbi:MAG: hypothetical protein J7605_26615 [Variovorax sp.]|nr:hypothetical protein [Variovorax sp.]